MRVDELNEWKSPSIIDPDAKMVNEDDGLRDNEPFTMRDVSGALTMTDGSNVND